MRLAELSQRSGVPRSTIKFYLREKILRPGTSQGRNQATYDDEHLERLALVTALREVAGLSLEVIARVTKELDRGWDGGDPIGEALLAIYEPPRRRRTDDEQAALDAAETEVRDFLRALPWTVDDERHWFADELADTLVQVRRYLFPDYPVSSLAPLAKVAWRLSAVEFENAPGGARVPVRAQGDDVAEPTRRAIVGTVLFERVFAALRRCANSMRSIRLSDGLPVPPVE